MAAQHKCLYTLPPAIRQDILKRYGTAVNFFHQEAQHLPYCTLIYKRALAGHLCSEPTIRDLCAALHTTPEAYEIIFVTPPGLMPRENTPRPPHHKAPSPRAVRTALLTPHTDILVKIKRCYRSYEAFLAAHAAHLSYAPDMYRRALRGLLVRPSVVQEICALARALPEPEDPDHRHTFRIKYLSPAMHAALAEAAAHGGILYYTPGGYWARKGWTVTEAAQRASTWFSSQTIQGLVFRHLMEYTSWKSPDTRTRPLTVQIVQPEAESAKQPESESGSLPHGMGQVHAAGSHGRDPNR